MACVKLSVFLLLMVAVGVHGGNEIRGLSPDKKKLYKSGQDFTCLDGSSTMPFSLVNDDYCDCRDGSDEPGTSACPNGRFHCTNKGHKGLDILSSRVDDGICDCCDGSDEHNSDVECPNTCEEQGKKAKVERQREMELREQGYKKRVEYAEQGEAKRHESEKKVAELEAELKDLEPELDALRGVKEAAEQPEREAKDEHKKRWEEEKEVRKEAKRKAEAKSGFDELDTSSDGFVSLDEIRARVELDDDGDGEVTEKEALEYLDNEEKVDFEAFYERVWDVVSDKCQFQPAAVVSEEREQPPPEETLEEEEDEDEEEEEEEEEDYDYDDIEPFHKESDEMPDYDNATKELIAVAEKAREAYRHTDSKKKNVERELGDLKKYLGVSLGHNNEFGPLYDQCYEYTDREYTYKMCAFGKVTQRGKKGGRETALGTWGSWSGPSGNPYSVMKYENGEKCWNGPSRSTMVTLKCGIEDVLVAASEPNRCEYAMEFITPAICEPLPEQPGFEHTEL